MKTINKVLIFLGLIIGLVGCTTSSITSISLSTDLVTSISPSTSTDISSVYYEIHNTYTDIFDEINPSTGVVFALTDANSIFNQGSGFIYEKEDDTYYVVTNRSSIVGTNLHYELLFGNDYRFAATFVGEYIPYDVSVLSFTTDIDMPVPTIGHFDDMTIGEEILAIGSPVFAGQLRNTLTKGVVSGLHRQVQDSTGLIDYPAFQIDAPFNEGSLGGPVINADSEIVGVLGLKVVESGESIESIGFAASLDDLQTILHDIIHSPVHQYLRPRMGVLVSDIRLMDMVTREENNIPTTIYQGLYVQEVSAGTAAALAGLPAGSVIVALNGTEVNTMAEISSILYRLRIGATVIITISSGTEYTLILKGAA